jgi:hypothetical protein
MGKFQTPSLEQSFGTQYYGTSIVSAFMYDVSTSILYTIYPTINYDVFLGVPLSVAQQFAVADAQLGGSYRNPNIPYPDNIYLNQVFSPVAVGMADLVTNDNVPIVTNSGDNIVTNQNLNTGLFPPLGVSVYPRCILVENGAPLLTEDGKYLVN